MKRRWSVTYLERKFGSPRLAQEWINHRRRELELETGTTWTEDQSHGFATFEIRASSKTPRVPYSAEEGLAFIEAANRTPVKHSSGHMVNFTAIAEATDLGYAKTACIAWDLLVDRRLTPHVNRRGHCVAGSFM